MEQVLILTGWGVDYGCAGAVALLKFPAAALRGVSRRRLPGVLGELARSKTALPAQLYILGVALDHEPETLLRALKRLKKAGVGCHWLSILPPPPGLAGALPGLLELHVAEEKTSLSRFTAAVLKVKKGAAAGILRVADPPGGRRSQAEQARGELLEAANWKHRIDDDLGPYTAAVRTLAQGLDLNADQQALVQNYQRFKHLELRGESRAVEELWELITAVGRDGQCPVLISGETGTGKEVAASLIHLKSSRARQPFEALNCANLSPQLLQSELFGHRQGAFTGADHDYRGAFARADGGTLFLDEIGDVPTDIQAGLLRVLEHKRFLPLGAEEELEVDVRVIAASNRDLWQMVESGRFRADLMYRLNVIEIHLPPLRDRRKDIGAIANSYLLNQGRGRLSPDQLRQLQDYDWPGNVRQLLNILERARILGDNDYANLLAGQPRAAPGDRSEAPVSDRLADVIRAHARQLFAKCGRNKSKTAKALGITVNTLNKYLAN